MTDHKDLIERLEKAEGSDTLKAVLLGMKNAEMTCLEAAAALREQQAEVERLQKAIKRISEPIAFYVATSHVDPETVGRMWFAQHIADGRTISEAESLAEIEAQKLARAALGKDGA